ncbi:MAG: band 7 protein [Candidatus Magasanikbacteria bacterium CG_4_10_14_0_2_um_filter_33_14]|uniref:Band 7 protein n=1 Tax=Candidatus Magasanikbacteria bacterium CG_4_10_14_0_2_um_filter_33_14 TaxID=1974636 RepID=A0A2M7VBH5_9BACT|nr:MAG: band 7 protein [Candidatus Magasanikbacteria bacterium CG_4_10_14_0_2_um_filter_33_14]
MKKLDKNGLVFWLILFFLVSLVLKNFLFFLGIIFLLFFFLKKTGKTEMITNFFSKINFKKNNSEPIMETINPNKYSPKRIIWTLSFIFLFFIVLSFTSSFWVVIGAGETGVQSLFGKVMDEEMSSGFHLKNPFVKITKLNIRTSEYTMSIAQGEGKRYSADAITALTKEGLSVDLDITVLYHLVEEKASDVYRDLGLSYEETIIRPQIRSIIREVTANYNVKDVYSDKRQEVALDIEERLKEKMDPRGITLEEVLLRHVELPANLADSIQQKLQAEQESERYDFVLEKEKKEAERKRIEAEGQRDSQKIINESLSNNYLEYLYINSLKDRAGTIYVPTGSNGLPIFKGL